MSEHILQKIKLRYSELLRSDQFQFLTDVSRYPIGLPLKGLSDT